jgi:two-component system sensor histidine kinase DegS
MKERVDLLDGEITIDSKIGRGTAVFIRVPLTD